MNYKHKGFSKLEFIIIILILFLSIFIAIPIVNSIRTYFPISNSISTEESSFQMNEGDNSITLVGILNKNK